jgi:putative oxidoreductase
MDRLLGRFAPEGYALARIIAGLLFACHGAQKLFGVLGGQAMPLTSQMGLAGLIEFVGGLMIAAGFLTTYAAFIASGEMAFAYFQAHAPKDVWPIRNGGEPAVLYCFFFLYAAARGSGVWSVDRLLARAAATRGATRFQPASHDFARRRSDRVA